MGRHVISVVVTGDASDFNRAMRNVDADVRRLSKGLADVGSSTDELNKRLNVSSAQINRFANSIKKAYPDIEGLGRAMDDLRRREAIRIKTIFRIEEATKKVGTLSRNLGIAGGLLSGINFAAAAVSVALVAISQTLVAAVGGGMVAAFGALYFSVEENREALAKVASTIRDDLINDSMKPFFDLMGDLPNVLASSYQAAEDEIVKLGRALEPLLKSFYDFLPDFSEKLVKALTTAAKAAQPFFDALLESLNYLVEGIEAFFAAFKNTGDTEVLVLFFKDIKKLLKLIGESLASLDASAYKSLRKNIIDFATAAVDAFKLILGAARGLDDFLKSNFGTSLASVAGGFLAVWAAAKLIKIPLAVISGLWKTINVKALKNAFVVKDIDGKTKKAVGSTSKLAAAWAAITFPFKAIANGIKVIGGPVKFVTEAFKALGSKLLTVGKFVGRFSVIATVLFVVYDVIKKIFEEGSLLNDLWNNIAFPALEFLIDGFKQLWQAVQESVAIIKGAWDDLYATLEDTGVIDVVSTVIGTIVDWLGKLYNAFLTISGGVWLAQLTVVWGILGAALRVVAAVIKVVAQGIAILIGWIANAINAVKDWWNSSNVLAVGIRASFEIIKTAFNVVKAVVTRVVQFIIALWKKWYQVAKPIFNGIKNFVVAAFNFIKSKVLPVANAIKDKVVAAFNRMKAIIQTVINFLKPFVAAAWSVIKNKIINPAIAIKDKVVAAFQKLKDLVVRAITALKDRLKAIWDAILSFAKGVVTKMVNIGRDIVAGIARGISAAKDMVMSAVRGIIDAIPDFVKDLMGIGSPAKRMMPLGKNITEGVAVGIGQGSSEMTKALDKAFNEIINNEPELKSLWDAEIKAAKDAAGAIETIFEKSGATIQSSSKNVNLNGVTAVGNGSTEVTYNITVNSNSPNVGREIVREIQKYESANGSRWRQ